MYVLLIHYRWDSLDAALGGPEGPVIGSVTGPDGSTGYMPVFDTMDAALWARKDSLHPDAAIAEIMGVQADG